MGMDSVLTSPTTIRMPARSCDSRTPEDRLRAEIRAWASWKADPAHWEAWGLEAHGLAPVDEPAAGDSQPRPDVADEPDADSFEHGTTRGARRHRERDEPLCDRCREAARVADRRYKAAARTRKPVAR